MIANHSPLESRFPIGAKVINLGSIEAYVKGYIEHCDGSFALLLHEKRPNGKFRRSHWEANPEKCQLA